MNRRNIRYVPFAKAWSETGSLQVQLFLNQAGIDYVTRSENVQFLFGGGLSTGINPVAGPVKLLVKEDHLEAAESAAIAAFEIHPHDSAGSCPACNQAVHSGTIDCPGCGLFLA